MSVMNTVIEIRTKCYGNTNYSAINNSTWKRQGYIHSADNI